MQLQGLPFRTLPSTDREIPRPPPAAYFAAMEKRCCCFFSNNGEKSCEGRPGYEAPHSHLLSLPSIKRTGQNGSKLTRSSIISHTSSLSGRSVYLISQANCHGHLCQANPFLQSKRLLKRPKLISALGSSVHAQHFTHKN